MRRKYGMIALVATLGIAALYFAGLLPGRNDAVPVQTIQTFVAEQADAALSLWDWMQAKDIDAIKLLNKSNRRYGKGVSVQAGQLDCFFEGEGAYELFAITVLEQSGGVTSKPFELIEWAKQYGAYAYIRHDGAFEVIISGDPFKRLGGVEGTSVYVSGLPEHKLEALGIGKGEPLEGGWFLADKKQKPVNIDTKPEMFGIVVVTGVVGLMSLIWFLLHKKRECDAEVVAKNAEYVGLMPRLWWHIHGIPRSWRRNGHVYSATFLTDKNERLTMYMYESDYNGLEEGAYGHLEYRRFKNRCRFTRFTEKESESI